MKYFRQLLAFLLCFYQPFYLSAALQSFKAGYSTTDTASNLISIVSNPSTGGNYMTCETPVGTDYQVPVGYTLYITRILFDVASSGDGVRIGYGDDGVANGASAPTNPKFISGNIRSTTAIHTVVLDLWLNSVPAGKYPFVYSFSGSDYVTLDGILVAN